MTEVRITTPDANAFRKAMDKGAPRIRRSIRKAVADSVLHVAAGSPLDPAAGALVIDPIDRFVGNAIRLRRKALRLSQAELGKALEVSFQQVQKYERGANRVSASTLSRIADKLECGVADLFPRSDVIHGEEPPPIGHARRIALERPGGGVLLADLVSLPGWAFSIVANAARTLALNVGEDR